jgi:hypothetical protein
MIRIRNDWDSNRGRLPSGVRGEFTLTPSPPGRRGGDLRDLPCGLFMPQKFPKLILQSSFIKA